MARLKEDLSSSHGMNAQYQKDIERLDTLVKKLDHSREQDRKIIVEEVSQEISRLSKKISSPSHTSATPAKEKTEKPKTSTSENNLEHTVVKGETLYSIATTYGVSVQSLKESNKLKVNELRVGQKLMIPKR